MTAPNHNAGPDGLDLRMTWPERQLECRRRNLKRGLHDLADAELPLLPDFIQRCGGKMPDTLDAMLATPYGDKLEAYWTHLYRTRPRLSYELAQMQLHADARWAYAVEWWEYEGRRVYLLDPTTAHALMATKLDDYPTAEFKLPLRSFFIRLPRELGWRFQLTDDALTVLSQPLNTHPESSQELDGFHVTADMDGSRLVSLELVSAGRSTFGPEGDHMMWGEIPFAQFATLGDVIRQKLVASPRATTMQMTEGGLSEKILHLVLGTVLYITSTHPELRAIEPPSHATISKAAKAGGPRAQRAAERSRYAITYVGGPRSGFRQAPGPDGTDDLVRQPPRPHMRCGHMRRVWLGARDSQERHAETRWIQPVMVGSWDRVAAYQAEKGYRFVMHKTRPAEVVHPAQPEVEHA